MPTVIHVSPHPDDESIAAPCTLLALQRNGWKVINYAVGLGRESDRARRRQELERALSHTRIEGGKGWRNLTPVTPIGISRGDNLRAASQTLTHHLLKLIDDEHADLIVGPHPRDGHHGHVAVARAIRQALWSARRPPVWWMWSIWSDLLRPTLIVECHPDDLDTSILMLKEYAGENRRSDYVAGTRALRVTNAVFGIEKTLGWGSAPRERLAGIEQAELLTEIHVRRTRTLGRPRAWMVARPRVLEPENALAAQWDKLDDFSILSPARFRQLLRPTALSWLSQSSWWQARSGAEPLPQPDPSLEKRSGRVPPERSRTPATGSSEGPPGYPDPEYPPRSELPAVTSGCVREASMHAAPRR
jgi:hypothetical protein